MDRTDTGAVDEDMLARAEHVLRTRDISCTRYGWRGLGDSARRAVEVLAEAGLLAERPRHIAPAELTADRAELLVRRGLARERDTIVVAESGTLRLEWCTAIRAYRLTDHTGEYYRGTDDTAAAAAFNEIAGSVVAR
ncbi:hypothetical protein [Amycolatopsis sp. NPDC051903]|uniref:hypothetical protein n=1 Tax=Amycolatopsis sp. NPDC051903 TaxID=3363936 RepID=UPI003792FD17